MRARTGYWKDRATQPPPRFGEAGTRVVEYLGDRPFESRGAATGKLYVFTDRHPRHVVDARDLPGLAKAAGRDQLRSLPESEPEANERVTEEVEDYDGSDDSAGQDA